MAVLICVGFSLFILNAQPINSDVFLGDDLQVWEGHNSGTYASNFQESIRNTSLDKWRPLHTTLMVHVLNVFGDTYRNYYWFGTTLLVMVLITMWVTIHTITGGITKKALPVALLGLLVVANSPFTFFARAGVFGLLELGPVILCLWSFVVYQRGRALGSRRLVTYSSLIALAAGLIHERFLVFSLCLALLIFWRSRKTKQFRGMWLLPLGNVAFYLYSAAVVLNANAFKGGGESNLNETIGFWVFPRYLNAVVQLLGGAGGESVFYDPTQPSQFTAGMTFFDNYSLVLPVMGTVGGFLLAAPIFLRKPDIRLADTHSRATVSQCLDAFLISGALLMPAATVAGRIEARWLFGSLVFLMVAISSLPPPRQLTSKFSQFGILVLLVLGSISHRDSYGEFDFWRVRATNILNAARDNAPTSGAWNVAVVWPDDWQDINSVASWALGNGVVFRDFDNGPHEIIFGTSDRISSCPAPCLVIEVKDVGNTKRDYRKVDFQSITTTWKY